MLQREEIYQRVWGYAMVHGDRSVDVFVRKLRQKLERASPDWRYIHTHFGIGYRFAAEPVEEPVGAALPRRRSRPGAAAGVPSRGPSRPRPSRSTSPRTRVEVRMGPDRNKHLRNIAIILALAVAVWKLPGGGTASRRSRTSSRSSSSAGLFFFGYRLYMEHRETIFGLEERQRGAPLRRRSRWSPSRSSPPAACGTRRPRRRCSGCSCSAPPAGRMYSVWRAYRTY